MPILFIRHLGRVIFCLSQNYTAFLCKLGVYNDYISKQCHCFDTYFMLFFIGFIDMLRGNLSE